MVRWLRLHAFSAEGSGSIPGQGTKIPQAMWRGMKEQNEVIFKKKKMLESLSILKKKFQV